MKRYFRWIGIVGGFIGIICRFNPEIVLPVACSPGIELGIRISAFSDLMNIIILCSCIMIILSFTTIVESSDEPSEEDKLLERKRRDDWNKFMKKKKIIGKNL